MGVNWEIHYQIPSNKDAVGVGSRGICSRGEMGENMAFSLKGQKPV